MCPVWDHSVTIAFLHKLDGRDLKKVLKSSEHWGGAVLRRFGFDQEYGFPGIGDEKINLLLIPVFDEMMGKGAKAQFIPGGNGPP